MNLVGWCGRDGSARGQAEPGLRPGPFHLPVLPPRFIPFTAPFSSLRPLLGFLLLLLLCSGAWPLLAQNPEDRYVKVYAQIEEADKLRESGQLAAALTRYLEAQVGLKNLQQSFPEWNSRLLGYRLEYIASKLEPLTRKGPGTTADGAAGSTGVATAAVVEQVRAMQEDIERLTAQNGLLQAKLREALTVQPAAVDPRELGKAEEHIKQLQKERDLLIVTLEQSNSTLGSADPGAARRTLVTQTAVATVLQKQNEELLRRIGELTARLKASSRNGAAGPNAGAGGLSTPDSLALREKVAALEASNRVLQEEQVSMESRLKEFVRQHGTASVQRQKELEQQLAEARVAAATARQERDELITKLTAVTRELNQRAESEARSASPLPAAANTAELERQLEGIRARLQIFEARHVPYNAEELALFRRDPIKVASSRTNASLARVTAGAIPPVPPAVAPLLATANQAVAEHRLGEAERRLLLALQQDPANVPLLARLAAVQLDQGKPSEADATLARALQADPQNAVALSLYGGLKLRQEQFDAALEALSRSAKADPDNAQTQFFLGQALIQKGSRGPAEAALRRALQIQPGWGDAHYQLAVLYAAQETNFRELAQYHYNKAIAAGVARQYDLEKLLQQGPGPRRP